MHPRPLSQRRSTCYRHYWQTLYNSSTTQWPRHIAPNDHFAGTVEDMHHVAQSVNATTATIDDAGHWWMCSHPEQAASILIEHWERFED